MSGSAELVIVGTDDGFRVYSSANPSRSYPVSGGLDHPTCTCPDLQQGAGVSKPPVASRIAKSVAPSYQTKSLMPSSSLATVKAVAAMLMNTSSAALATSIPTNRLISLMFYLSSARLAPPCNQTLPSFTTGRAKRWRWRRDPRC